MKYKLKTIVFLSLIMVGCNSQLSYNDKEKELLEKEIELLKKEKELLQNNSSESSVYYEKEIKQPVEDRIIEIKEFYSEIQKSSNNDKNCISSKRKRRDEFGEYENHAKICHLTGDLMYQQVKLNGHEWEETASFYYKGNKCFFVYINSFSEACAHSYRVYYDRNGEVIRVLLAENDCDGDNVGSNVEVTDRNQKQEILNSIAYSKKELSAILKR
ncbi:MAG: hypothetical protein QNL60_02250 [Flavobacteriales bacterium]